MPNRLAAEKSPYLLQHADNPVDWYPWGDEAFGRARREDKPIFLSIGYSTCHWCHVMAHESFENLEVAAVLNREFVPVKVDREERPDVDRVYMTFVQATTGAGGWPMSVWLTPDLQPFFGGTYFPPTARWQRPGFIDVLLEIARVWKTDRQQVVASAERLVAALREGTRAESGHAVPGVEVLAHTRRQFEAMYDRRRGGFGEAPKFPRPSELLFLLREHARTAEASPRDMVLHTLRAMALGGMRDHIGGGFHRYSVDGDWRVPHFEKMLYDQAQLVLAYLEAAQASGDAFYASVAEDTLQYVAREMTHPDGGFYSAEDADSVPPEQAGRPDAHKTEGAFYVWSAAELEQRLGDHAAIFAARFGVEPGGNAPFDPQGEFVGKNLLYTARSIEEVAEAAGASPDAVRDALASARLALFAARLERPRPHLDDKVLCGWNGLMIAAFARAARVLEARAFGSDGSAGYLEAAVRAASFLRDRLWVPDRQVLLRRFRDGEAAIDGYAEDYAYTIFGALELFQASGDATWLDWAVTLQERQNALFWDAAAGGWFSTTGEDPSVLMRLKEDYDGAEPSANSIATLNLLTIAHLTASADAEERARRTLGAFRSRLAEHGRMVPMMSAALTVWHAELAQVVIAGDPSHDRTRALVETLATTYHPFTVVVLVDPGRPQPELLRLLPFVEPLHAAASTPTAYVCRGFTCDAPASSPDELRDRLAAAVSTKAGD
jgi:uncharacterized protein YyaL (SSP411 family)